MNFKPVEFEVAAPGRTVPETEAAPARVGIAPAEFFISEKPGAGESVTQVFQRVAERLAAKRAAIASVMVYGALSARGEIDLAMQTALGPVMWPLTWVEGASCTESPLAGVQVLALCGREVRRVLLGNRVVGTVFE